MVEGAGVLLYPPANIDLVALEQEAPDDVAIVVSPKSVAFPVVAIVIKSISFYLSDPSKPPAITPLVDELIGAEPPPLATVKSPKSFVIPPDCISI